MNEKQIKKTPLHDWHLKHGANMAVFGGYEMPLWYPSGAKREHLAVLSGAGMFDTSHMAVIMVEGSGALALLHACFTKNLDACMGKDKTPLVPGRCAYGAFLDDLGHVRDDSIVSQVAPEMYMIVVNAGMGEEIAGYLKDRAGGLDVEIHDLTDGVGKMDIQGPMSARILAKILREPEAVFDRMVYFSFRGFFDDDSPLADAVRLSDGTPVMLSRTGYTGEFGFEIFMNPDHIERVWKMALEAGKDSGLTVCGLAARDSLRTGAVLPLSHQDIGPWPFINNPWSFALPFNDDRTGFTKKFTGDEALRNIEKPEYTYPFAGFDLRKVSPGDSTVVTDSGGSRIGAVLTCVTDMAIGRVEGKICSAASPDRPDGFNPKGLSCGFVRVTKKLSGGDTVELKDDRRTIKVVIVDDIRPDRTARRAIKNML
ncbi:MAG: aminomethyltransferase family protein [Deltaproteobacteria bacterium]|nr:aminomethyltransferase family protein [Deltaproteobacteria bacterium]MBW2595759.1 aminomethyltransferase family protein [Deltaproteobacteria bacterium]